MAEKHEKQQATSEAMNSLCIQPQTCFYNVCKKKTKNTKIILFLFLLTLRWMFSCVFKSANLSVCFRFREKLGVKTVKALKRNNNGVTHAAIDMLCALMCVSHLSMEMSNIFKPMLKRKHSSFKSKDKVLDKSRS